MIRWKNNIESWKIDIVLTVIIMLCLFFSNIIYAGKNLGGNYNWIMLPSNLFGVPSSIEKLGIEPLYMDNSTPGWDGQFYYYISNDLLGLKDTPMHIDSPAYRYQRIGLPLISKAVSMIFLQKMVTVPLFILTNIFLLGLALFVLLQYLVENRCSRMWALPWILSAGVLITMRHLLPDGAADSLVIIAIIMLLKNRNALYSIFMTLGCLTREGYVLIALFIFIIKMLEELNRVSYKVKKLNYKLFFQFSIPGIIFIFWYLYVSIHFGIFPFSQATNITDFYLKGWLTYIFKAISESNIIEFNHLLFYFITVVFSLVYSYMRGKDNKIFWAFIPYIILISSFGATVLEHWSFYLKGISIVFALLPIMLATNNKKTYIATVDENKKIVLLYNIQKISRNIIMLISVVSVITGIYGYKNFPIIHLEEVRYRNKEQYVGSDIQALTDFSSKLFIKRKENKKFISNKWMYPFTENYDIYTIQVKNISNTKWSMLANSDGSNAINLSYQWFDKNDLETVVQDGNRASLIKDLESGDTCDMELYVKYPEKKGNYILRISLVQEGVSWFYSQPNAGYIDIPYTIQ